MKKILLSLSFVLTVSAQAIAGDYACHDKYEKKYKSNIPDIISLTITSSPLLIGSFFNPLVLPLFGAAVVTVPTMMALQNYRDKNYTPVFQIFNTADKDWSSVMDEFDEFIENYKAVLLSDHSRLESEMLAIRVNQVRRGETDLITIEEYMNIVRNWTREDFIRGKNAIEVFIEKLNIDSSITYDQVRNAILRVRSTGEMCSGIKLKNIKYFKNRVKEILDT